MSARRRGPWNHQVRVRADCVTRGGRCSDIKLPAGPKGPSRTSSVPLSSYPLLTSSSSRHSFLPAFLSKPSLRSAALDLKTDLLFHALHMLPVRVCSVTCSDFLRIRTSSFRSLTGSSSCYALLKEGTHRSALRVPLILQSTL